MFTLIAAVTFLLALATVLPALPVAHGFVRTCDFPRLQIAALAATFIPLTLLYVPLGPWGLALVAVQTVVLVLQLAVCLRFTPFWKVQSIAYDGEPRGDNTIRILSSNVKMSNRDYGRLVGLVREMQPDVFVLMEIDEPWLEALAPLASVYPHRVEQPQDNAYGMVLYSRLPLSDTQLMFRLLEGVPSISTVVTLRDGAQIRLHAVHPEPPIPHMDTLGRDAEIVLVAREVVDDPLPCIVTGDLNDVAWSRTTQRFQRLTGLLDPRVGRGFFNSFDARFWFMRWPLDHLFHDPAFRVIEVKRLPHVGSDHFPMWFALALTPIEASEEAPERPDQADRQEAREVVVEAQQLDREPIGTDWEK